jgi:hypothetical protein
MLINNIQNQFPIKTKIAALDTNLQSFDGASVYSYKF